MASPSTIATESSLPAQGSRAASWTPWAAAGLVFLTALVLAWPDKLDHDLSYFLAVDALLRDGARLYIDVIEFNTSAAFALTRIAGWIADATGWPVDQTFKALAYAITAACTALAFTVLRDELDTPGWRRWVLALGIPAILLYATPAIGSREQLLCAGLLPWALQIATRRQQPLWLSIAIGAVVGAALFFKPHFILFAVALGAFDLARAGWSPLRLSASTWTGAAVSIALYASFLLTQPAWLNEMLSFMLVTYGQMKASAAAMAVSFFTSPKLLTIPAAIGAAFILWRADPKAFPWRSTAIVAALSGAAMLLFLQQGYGFAYQLLPLKMTLALAMLFVGLHAPGLTARALSAVVLVLALSWPPLALKPQPTRASVTEHPLYKALQPEHPGDAILVIAPAVNPTSEMLTLMDARWSAPIIPFIPIPALIEQGGRTAIAHPPAEADRQRWADWFRQRVAASFAANPPTRVAVEITDKPLFFDKAGFDMLAWLREDPAFDVAWTSAGLKPSGQPIYWEDEKRTYQVWSN